MRKLRILFDVSGHDTWIGGVYYLRNILYQITVNNNIVNTCKPIIVCSSKFSDIFCPFENVAEVIVFEYGNKFARLRALRKAFKNIDWIYYYHRYKFDPFNILRRKAIDWIPDFQELYYPAFFTNEQLSFRCERAKKAEDKRAALVLSSKSCKADYLSKYSKDENDIFVIPFVSAIEKEIKDITNVYLDSILKKYEIQNGKYFIVSNQFWQHKNHIVVFKAIAELKRTKWIDYKFVFTGELKDYRNKEYYDSITEVIRNSDIQNDILILGFLTRREQLALMLGSKAVIQPSLFEGWGTVVEDAKVLDKTILLSDIPVHHEQMNEKCILFDPHDPVALTDLIYQESQKEHHDDIEKGIADMHKRAKEYSKGFEQLLRDLEKKK